MFWRGAHPGLSVEAEPEGDYTQTAAELEEQIEKYVHGLTRVLKLQGMEAKQLLPAIAEPTAHAELQLKLISAVTKIPTRILIGSESGQLASDQDMRIWRDYIDERRAIFAEPSVVRPLVAMWVKYGVLPKPAAVFVSWPSIETVNESERSQVALRSSEALSYYVRNGVWRVMTLNKFLTLVVGLTAAEADAAIAELPPDWEERLREIEDLKVQAELQRKTAGAGARGEGDVGENTRREQTRSASPKKGAVRRGGKKPPVNAG
jgi:hypothetical protein